MHRNIPLFELVVFCSTHSRVSMAAELTLFLPKRNADTALVAERLCLSGGFNREAPVWITSVHFLTEVR